MTVTFPRSLRVPRTTWPSLTIFSAASNRPLLSMVNGSQQEQSTEKIGDCLALLCGRITCRCRVTARFRTRSSPPPPVRRPGLVDHFLKRGYSLPHPCLLSELFPDVPDAGALGPKHLCSVVSCRDSADPLPESPGRRSGRWKFIRRPDSPKRRGCERKLSRVPLFRHWGRKGDIPPAPIPSNSPLRSFVHLFAVSLESTQEDTEEGG